MSRDNRNRARRAPQQQAPAPSSTPEELDQDTAAPGSPPETPATGPVHTPTTPAEQGKQPTTPPEEEQPEPEQSHGPHWSASEAARRCGTSRATMTRRLQAGAIPGATRDAAGAWLVPLSGLLAAGFHPDRPAPPEEQQDQDAEAATADALRDAHHSRELAEIRAALDLERARRQAAEELAAERAARVSDLRRALLALAPPETPQDAPETVPQSEPSPEPAPLPSTPQQAAPGPSSTPQPEPSTRGPFRRLLGRLRGDR